VISYLPITSHQPPTTNYGGFFMLDKFLKRKSELIGQIMINAGYINHQQLRHALKVKKKEEGYLGEILIKLGYITRADLTSALQEQLSHSIVPISSKDLDTPQASEFYRLQTNIKFALFSDEPIKTLMFTSSVPQEGKSMSVSYFALVMANVMEKNTLLVDADLRHPSLNVQFGLNSPFGLCDVLVGSKTLEECIQNTEIKNLKILSCGTKPPNPAALFASQKMKSLVNQLKEKFDLVLFDSSPVFPVADASILSTNIDATILVIGAGLTRRQFVQRALDILKESNTKVLGAILNRIEEEEMPGYAYHKSYR
jgi:protein-tyrosine kinase